jgi:hypothetical protein
MKTMKEEGEIVEERAGVVRGKESKLRLGRWKVNASLSLNNKIEDFSENKTK